MISGYCVDGLSCQYYSTTILTFYNLTPPAPPLTKSTASFIDRTWKNHLV